MIYIESMTFNAFQENTYIVYNDNNDAIIFDPGCNNQSEREVLISFIDRKKLKPLRLINTHCHIDHVLGNKFISEKYGLRLEAHKLEAPVLASGVTVSTMYGIPYVESPSIEIFLNEGEELTLGDESFEMLLCPGHSPGSLCFYHSSSKTLIGGDVLFQNSIGRTDLPGGDYDTLINVIKEKIFSLPEDTVVYSGHGPSTSVGYEKKNNPFLS